MVEIGKVAMAVLELVVPVQMGMAHAGW